MRTSSSSGIVPTGYASCSARLRRRAVVDVHAGEAVQSDQLDQAADMRLGAAEAQGPPAHPQTLRDHRQVDHQRRVGEAQLG